MSGGLSKVNLYSLAGILVVAGLASVTVLSQKSSADSIEGATGGISVAADIDQPTSSSENIADIQIEKKNGRTFTSKLTNPERLTLFKKMPAGSYTITLSNINAHYNLVEKYGLDNFNPRFNITVKAGKTSKVTFSFNRSKQAGAILSLVPTGGSFSVGSDIEVPILINTNNAETSQIDLRLQFDPMVLQVIDSNTAKPGIQIEEGSLYSSTSLNEAKVISPYYSGEIRYKAAGVFKGSGRVATIHFKALKDSEAAVDMSYVRFASRQVFYGLAVTQVNNAHYTITPSQSGQATLSIIPSNITGFADPSGAYTLQIWLDTGGAKTQGADVVMHFDPTAFYISDDGTSTDDSAHERVVPGSLYSQVTANNIDNAAGTIKFSAVTAPGQTFSKTGELFHFPITRIKREVSNSPISFDFTLDATTDSNVAATINGQVKDVLGKVINGSYSFK